MPMYQMSEQIISKSCPDVSLDLTIEAIRKCKNIAVIKVYDLSMDRVYEITESDIDRAWKAAAGIGGQRYVTKSELKKELLKNNN